MKFKSLNPVKVMWRTQVKVHSKTEDDVNLIIPDYDSNKIIVCPRQAIPPFIFDKMKKGSKWHVKCNIGAPQECSGPTKLCYDEWEP